jgi:hypothetical protein
LNKNIPMTRVQETHVTWKYSIQCIMVSDNNIFVIMYTCQQGGHFQKLPKCTLKLGKSVFQIFNI